jgi:hypothetical protein
MTFQQMYKTIESLGFNTELRIHDDGEYEVFVLRPSKLGARFKNYDPKTNFQIWLRKGDRQFKPNHLRVMVDLYLRSRSRPDLKAKLGQAFDDIFYGASVEEAIKQIDHEVFEHYLNSLMVTANLSQLFLIEQSMGYNKPSKYSPPTLFYQGWVRQTIDSKEEIDNILMSIGYRRPPAIGYTSVDDSNHKKYNQNRVPLWWMDNAN